MLKSYKDELEELYINLFYYFCLEKTLENQNVCMEGTTTTNLPLGWHKHIYSMPDRGKIVCFAT